MSRLRWKLLAAMVAVVVVTTGISALVMRRATHDQVLRLLVRPTDQPSDQLLRPLEDHLRATGGWRGVDAVIEQLGTAQHCRLVLVSPGGQVIAASAALATATITPGATGQLTVAADRGDHRERLTATAVLPPIRDAAGQPAARVYVFPEPLDDPAGRELAAVDHRVLVGFAISMLVALGLTIVVSRRITRPIEQLTAAVQRVGRTTPPAHVQVRGRDEIARLATTFNAMADAVATHEELRRRMVGDVAHELRTPLTNLRCELEAILDGLSAPDPERIASLHEEVLHLQRLVEDLQELAVAEAGALALQLERIDLGPAIARMVGAQADVAHEAGLAVDVDVTRLRQIVQNVVANALRHAPDGTRVRIRVVRAGADAAVSVIDRGPGIPAHDLERIFERFYRVDAARGRAGGGAGLGLAIVRRLIELHHGRVWAESVEGEGATLMFTLPLRAS